MARTRSVKPGFWSDEKLANVSREARLLFVGLWTTSDDYGVSKGHPIWLRSQIFPFDADMSEEQMCNLLNELVQSGFVVPFDFNDEIYLHIPNFLKHQKIDHPSVNRNPEFRESLANHSRFIRESFAPNRVELSRVNINLASQDYDQGSSCRYSPEEELRREDLSRIVEVIAKWDCMHREANPYGIAGQIYNIIGRDVDFVLQVLKEKADYLKKASSSGHLIASVLALKQKDYNWRDIESRAHKEAASE